MTVNTQTNLPGVAAAQWPSPLTEEARFRDLLALTGDANIPWLLTQLHVDLSGAAQSFLRAAAAPDWDDLRRVTHGLAGIAGTVGAPDLRLLALEVNRAAHLRDTAALERTTDRLSQSLSALIADFAQRLAALPPPHHHKAAT